MYAYNATTNGYDTYTSGVGGLNGATKDLTSMQAVLVYAPNSGSANLALTNSHRTTLTTTAFKAVENQIENSVKIKVSGAKLSDETMILFGKNTSPAYDAAYDARKLENPNGLNIYTVSEGTKYAINGLNTNDENSILMPFESKEAGNYTLSFNFNNLNTQAMILEDKVTGTNTPIVNEQSINFNYTPGQSSDRFVIHYGKSATTLDNSASANIYSYGNTVAVEFAGSRKESSTITMSDVLGREVSAPVVMKNTQNKAEVQLSGVTTGYYLVRVTTASGVQTKKVFIIN